MDLKKTRVNTELEQTGVWHDLDGETEVLVARYGNPRHRARQFTDTMNARRRKLGVNDVNTIGVKILAEQVNDTLLMGWRNMKNDGEDYAYTPERALELLSDPEQHDFMERIIALSQDQAKYLKQNIEDTVKK